MVAVTVVERNTSTDNVNEKSRSKHVSADSNNTSTSDKIVEVLKNTRGPTSLLNRKEYENRLLTFQASTYYAKPPCLSPLFCARFGWQNADKDILVCSSCSSALAITLNSKLSASTFDKLCHAYRRKIVCNHDINCPFRLSSLEELRSLESSVEEDDDSYDPEEENNKSNAEHASYDAEVPVYMGQVLPEDSIRLMEYPKPSMLLKQKGEKLIAAIRSATNSTTTDKDAAGAENDAPTTWGYPRLQIPSKIRQMDSNSELTKMLGFDDISILALSLLGWNPIPNTRVKVDESMPTVSLGCPLCLSIIKLDPEQHQQKEGKGTEEDGGASESDRLTKRQRMSCRNFNPLEAHRHYCPYKVGFPKKCTGTVPLWKIILERLHKECQDDDIKNCTVVREEAKCVPIGVFDKAVEKVRRILHAGIAPKEIDLNA
mmetsp:Transcript_17361/g.38036  ORF Transcript_17361/g.38036 Transcript_17361/m.38036 type:complete len:430 (-) Transcript_17361:2189-3478(-)